MKTILTIDPGASGGLAVKYGDAQVYAVPMPATEGDLLEWLRFATKAAGETSDTCIAYLEAQQGVMGPGMRVSSSAMFTFGRGYGFLLGALMALEWSVVLVRPQEWQKALSLGTKAGAGGKTEWKNKLKAEAQRRFPHLKVTLKTADALLLMSYATKQT